MTYGIGLIGSGFMGKAHALGFLSVGWVFDLGDQAVDLAVLADIGSHISAAARYLLGPIDSVVGDVATAIAERPVTRGAAERRAVAVVDDIARAFLRFGSGATGAIEANWLASGRKMQLEFEIAGSKGGLYFTQERFTELQLYRSDDGTGRQGFRTIVAGPDHPPYGRFCVAGGHQIGFNDLKTIEIYDFLQAIAGERVRV